MSSLDDLAHLRIPLEDILSATNKFAEENVIGENWFGKRYKGQLLWSGELIEIDARRVHKDLEGEEQRFWMEISMLSTFKHKNVVSLVGFCYDNDEKVIITRHATRGSLRQYLSDLMLLTWVQRLEICVGIAHALSYIRYDESRDCSIIHHNIDSETVLLNDDWEPKLSCFECCMRIKATKRHMFDINKLGNLLFEVLCGRLPLEMALYHYNHKTLCEIIDWDLLKQIDSQSFDNFTKAAFDCLSINQLQHPVDFNEIVTRLEQALEHQNAVRNAILKRLRIGRLRSLSQDQRVIASVYKLY